IPCAYVTSELGDGRRQTHAQDRPLAQQIARRLLQPPLVQFPRYNHLAVPDPVEQRMASAPKQQGLVPRMHAKPPQAPVLVCPAPPAGMGIEPDGDGLAARCGTPAPERAGEMPARQQPLAMGNQSLALQHRPGGKPPWTAALPGLAPRAG